MQFVFRFVSCENGVSTGVGTSVDLAGRTPKSGSSSKVDKEGGGGRKHDVEEERELRSVLDLKPLDAFVVVPTMEIETVQSVRIALQIGQWAASMSVRCLLFDGRSYEFHVLRLVYRRVPMFLSEW